MDDSYLKKTEEKDGCIYYTYQIQAWSKSIKKYLLNVVVIKAVQKGSGKIGFKVLVSNDLELDFEKMVDYYSLRFQIEFDFRDAKQHFGLSDFKNHKEQNLTNFVNLSFLMCLINKILLDRKRKQYNIPKLNTADLKVIFRRAFTTIKLIKLLRNSPDLIFNDGFFDEQLPEELIHRA